MFIVPHDIKSAACKTSIRMTLLGPAIVLAILALTAPSFAHAQDVAPPAPEGSYNSAAPSADSLVQMPDSDPGGDGSVVNVPIPGGGVVRVEGPDLPVDNTLPPIDTWGGSAIAPNSVAGESPLGP